MTALELGGERGTSMAATAAASRWSSSSLPSLAEELPLRLGEPALLPAPHGGLAALLSGLAP